MLDMDCIVVTSFTPINILSLNSRELFRESVTTRDGPGIALCDLAFVGSVVCL